MTLNDYIKFLQITPSETVEAEAFVASASGRSPDDGLDPLQVILAVLAVKIRKLEAK